MPSRSSSSSCSVHAWPWVTAVREDSGGGGASATGRDSGTGATASAPRAGSPTGAASAPVSPRRAGSATGSGGSAISSRRASADSTIARSEVGQNGGSERWRKPAYRAVIIRLSRNATTPRSSERRISRPAPWARRSAAWVAETAMNPLPPIRAMAWDRAEASGSSGRGNGMRSMMTSWQDDPGTSTPCHSESVPNRHTRGSRANCLTSVLIWSSPWQRNAISPSLSANRSRIASVASLAARIEENSPSVRPPAARTSASISSRVSPARPSRPGGGRCWAT